MSINSQVGISSLRAALLLSLTAFALSDTAQANQCGDISQALTALGDNYYSLDHLESLDHRRHSSEYGKTEQQILLEQSKVFSQLRDARFKSGIGERTRCFGTGDNLRAESSRVELTDISQQNTRYLNESELVIDANEYDETEKRRRRESVYLSLTSNADVFATDDGSIIKLNSRRRQATLVGSFLRETDLSAITTDNGVDITQQTYVNGYLAEWFSWSLDTEK